MQYPSSACLLQAWEFAASERPVRRPLSWLSSAFGWSRSDLENLSLGERDRLILQARCLLFGTKMTGLVECKACNEQVECEIPVRALLDVPRVSNSMVSIEGEGFQVDVRMITAGDVEAVSNTPDCRELLFRRCVIHGSWPETQAESVIQVAGERLADADPLANISIDLVCPNCSASFAPTFDPWKFLWDELEIWARRVLQQVHFLASAYGWTEDQVLSLSASRRALYLQLVKR